MASGIEKRIEVLAERIGSRRARQIVVLVDGNAEDHSAANALLSKLDVRAKDMVVHVARFSGSDPDLPRLHSITPLNLKGHTQWLHRLTTRNSDIDLP